MQVSLEWLKDFVGIPKGVKPEDLGNMLTLKTAEVDAVHQQGKGLEGVVVGEILDIKKHPNADKLNMAKVNIGKKEPLSLIFGSMLVMRVGDRVPVAIAPTVLPTGMEIVAREMRGVKSEGMLCLDQELGFKEEGVSIQYFPKTKIGTSLTEALGLNDVIFEFDNKALTNRPDLWGHYGIALEVAVLTNGKFKSIHPKPLIPKTGESVKVDVKNPKLCPRYCGLIIENIKVGESPEWMKRRLRATGHGVHNNIVDVTNYVMTELGQPLHAFDKNYIKGGIVVRTAKKGEEIPTLDGKKRFLAEDMLIIADHEKPVAVAGIMGGENSEINENTTAIILESANFNAGNVRRTSTKLGVRTDSLQRFEKSLDPHLALLAINRAAELILKICPKAKIAGPITDVKNFDEKMLTIDLDIKKTQSKIGVDISATEMKKILESLMFEAKAKGKNALSVTVPTWRSSKDISIEDDLVEEIARIYGYENIPASLPDLPTKLPEENTERFKKHRLRELLSYGLGFNEIYNYSFYGKNDFQKCLMSEAGHLKLLNYLSEDQTHMRTSLIPGLLKNVCENVKNSDEVRVYEIGHAYKEIGKYFPLEEKEVVGIIVKKGKSENGFYEAKGAVELFFERNGIKGARMVKGVKNVPYAHPYKSVSYIHGDGQTLAKVFMLHPIVSKNFDLEKYKIAVFEINFSEAVKLMNCEKKYKQIPKFPGVDIDISILIDKSVEVAEIEKAIKKADISLIKNVQLFDIYEGENIEKGKKAVAFKISFLSEERTLMSEEAVAVQQKIFKNLETMGGVIRGKN